VLLGVEQIESLKGLRVIDELWCRALG
jgi:hypothetical protein